MSTKGGLMDLDRLFSVWREGEKSENQRMSLRLTPHYGAASDATFNLRSRFGDTMKPCPHEALFLT